MAKIWRCHGCGVGLAAVALIQPLAWEPPYAAGVALKKKSKWEYVFIVKFCSKYFSMKHEGHLC